MVRVAVSVEGTTEERFVSLLLRPHFSGLNIFITPINMRGNISIDRVVHELNRLIYQFDYVTTLYDFYGFKNIDQGDTKQMLEQKIIKNLKKSNNVIPYIQMYEFEGLLFSCPKAISRHLQGKQLEQWASDILQAFGDNPEEVNNSVNTAPSKRLLNNTNYRKTTHGPNIANDIGLQGLRDKCKGFNEWIDKLEKL